MHHRFFQVEPPTATLPPHEQAAELLEKIEDRGEPVYLVVHNLDGPALRSERAQAALALLAASPLVRLICSVDHINAPLVWDQGKLTRYNFAWFDATTYAPYAEETRYENSFLVAQAAGGALSLESMVQVFATLNPTGREIFARIVRHQLAAEGAPDYAGMPLPELYQNCRLDFLVNSDLMLRAQLTEFRDHKLLLVKKDGDGIENLVVPIADAVLQEFMDKQAEEGNL